MLFGVPFDASQVIGETLERATPETDFEDQRVIRTLRETIEMEVPPPESYDAFHLHPLASWIESTFGVEPENLFYLTGFWGEAIGILEKGGNTTIVAPPTPTPTTRTPVTAPSAGWSTTAAPTPPG